MAGTYYTLDRDKLENQNPMDLVKEKPCMRCGTVRPNDFRFFGKKLWKTRQGLTTNDVCIACQKAKVSASMKAKWAGRKAADVAWDQERFRMARAASQAVEAPRAPELVLNENDPDKRVLDNHDDDLGGIRPISIDEVLGSRSRG